MKPNTSLKVAAVCAALMTLSACGGSTGAEISAREPNFFSGKVREGIMNGTFNPAGYSDAQVKKVVGQTCASGRLTGFRVLPAEGGLKAFAATCRTWKSEARFVEYERMTDSKVLIEILGKVSGALVTSKIEASL